MSKIYKNNQLLWEDADKDLEFARKKLTSTLIERVCNQQNYALPDTTLPEEIDFAIETYKIKLDLLKKIKEFYYSDQMEFVIDTDPYNSFSRADSFIIIN